MEEKQTVVIISGVKAALTTATLFLAGMKIAEMGKLPDPYFLYTMLAISAVSGIAVWFYRTKLSSRGIVTIKDWIQTFSINWEDNAEILTNSWCKSAGIVLFLITNLVAISIFGYFVIAVALAGGAAFTYMARNEKKPVKYFCMGYGTGVGSLLCGVFIAYLAAILGPLLVYGFIISDAAITGIYTYMDLKEWEHEQNRRIQIAKAKVLG